MAGTPILAKPAARAAPPSAPGFMPKWMLQPGRVFNAEEALNAALLAGDATLADKLIAHYGLKADLKETLEKARLNAKLISAVHNADVELVRSLLEQGADPDSGFGWGGREYERFTVLDSASICADSPCYPQDERNRYFAIAQMLDRRNAAFSSSSQDVRPLRG